MYHIDLANAIKRAVESTNVDIISSIFHHVVPNIEKKHVLDFYEEFLLHTSRYDPEQLSILTRAMTGINVDADTLIQAFSQTSISSTNIKTLLDGLIPEHLKNYDAAMCRLIQSGNTTVAYAIAEKYNFRAIDVQQVDPHEEIRHRVVSYATDDLRKMISVIDRVQAGQLIDKDVYTKISDLFRSVPFDKPLPTLREGVIYDPELLSAFSSEHNPAGEVYRRIPCWVSVADMDIFSSAAFFNGSEYAVIDSDNGGYEEFIMSQGKPLKGACDDIAKKQIDYNFDWVSSSASEYDRAVIKEILSMPDLYARRIDPNAYVLAVVDIDELNCLSVGPHCSEAMSYANNYVSNFISLRSALGHWDRDGETKDRVEIRQSFADMDSMKSLSLEAASVLVDSIPHPAIWKAMTSWAKVTLPLVVALIKKWPEMGAQRYDISCFDKRQLDFILQENVSLTELQGINGPAAYMDENSAIEVVRRGFWPFGNKVPSLENAVTSKFFSKPTQEERVLISGRLEEATKLCDSPEAAIRILACAGPREKEVVGLLPRKYRGSVLLSDLGM